MHISGIHLIPLILFIMFPIVFLGTYYAAVIQGHVEPDFPYISDAASYSPESCVFGQFINLGALLMFILIYVRYCEIYEYQEQFSISDKVSKLNKIGLWLGLGSCLGLSIVANFQETNVKYVHFTGAMMCFGLGTAYFWVQTMCSYHMESIANSIHVAHFRLGLAMVCTVFFFVASTAGLLSHLKYHGNDPTKWYPYDGGWTLHVISTASEWVVAICFCFFIITYYSSFKNISFIHPQIIISNIQNDDRREALIS